jgi:hypothetical protein
MFAFWFLVPLILPDGRQSTPFPYDEVSQTMLVEANSLRSTLHSQRADGGSGLGKRARGKASSTRRCRIGRIAHHAGGWILGIGLAGRDREIHEARRRRPRSNERRRPSWPRQQARNRAPVDNAGSRNARRWARTAWRIGRQPCLARRRPAPNACIEHARRRERSSPPPALGRRHRTPRRRGYDPGDVAKDRPSARKYRSSVPDQRPRVWAPALSARPRGRSSGRIESQLPA